MCSAVFSALACSSTAWPGSALCLSWEALNGPSSEPGSMCLHSQNAGLFLLADTPHSALFTCLSPLNTGSVRPQSQPRGYPRMEWSISLQLAFSKQVLLLETAIIQLHSKSSKSLSRYQVLSHAPGPVVSKCFPHDDASIPYSHLTIDNCWDLTYAAHLLFLLGEVMLKCVCYTFSLHFPWNWSPVSLSG